MATVFRNMGLEEEGVDVNIQENKDAGRYAICNDFACITRNLSIGRVPKTLVAIAKTFGDLIWYYCLGWLIRYGYRPWNALGASLILVGFGTVVFWRGFSSKIIMPTDEKAYEAHKNGHLSESYPRFNPLIYSLETFVPLVKLGIAQCWIPNPGFLRCYFCFHILFGWILTSLWIAAFAGLLKR
jgi:hypothetical protein